VEAVKYVNLRTEQDGSVLAETHGCGCCSDWELVTRDELAEWIEELEGMLAYARAALRRRSCSAVVAARAPTRRLGLCRLPGTRVGQDGRTWCSRHAPRASEPVERPRRPHRSGTSWEGCKGGGEA
jgi:hypothetical protein